MTTSTTALFTNSDNKTTQNITRFIKEELKKALMTIDAMTESQAMTVIRKRSTSSKVKTLAEQIAVNASVEYMQSDLINDVSEVIFSIQSNSDCLCNDAKDTTMLMHQVGAIIKVANSIVEALLESYTECDNFESLSTSEMLDWLMFKDACHSYVVSYVDIIEEDLMEELLAA